VRREHPCGAEVRVTVNGAPCEVPPEATVLDVVVAVGVHPEGVAVAVNGEVVPRREHTSAKVQAGDRLEVIRAVGGG
jgi:sulfur carrier protein